MAATYIAAVAYPTIQFIPVSITGRAQDVSPGYDRKSLFLEYLIEAALVQL